MVLHVLLHIVVSPIANLAQRRLRDAVLLHAVLLHSFNRLEALSATAFGAFEGAVVGVLGFEVSAERFRGFEFFFASAAGVANGFLKNADVFRFWGKGF